ncbi:class I SAM-dependent methyltransferase [Paenibacillus sp. chi10]|uniref:Class I SAM-dependent methyltransferase n=1 Tax=Paenibacillus suaedae TaxID=3077233 RepID=A0AAJ2K4U8_9BACL|nr:class I SAM-dependent methyltransferase [Paenibacillus sp. chi10]MDT8979778.1 class I SAM-dependent methyltransferase [Paenibacillus sp. chi10]
MAKFNLDYYVPSTDDVYSDGDIESELLQYAISGKCDWHKDGRWPVVYHMSHLRHNILNWFPFKKECRILEIGAGCGALTGLLCELGSKVVAVELTKRRAEINYQRHKHFDNLEIVVCDFQKLPIESKFDYIIINGVLEYAAYMIESEQPYIDFLKLSAMHLNDKGKILLSIENRMGLKYFSGSKEDHTGVFFSGLNEYDNGEKVRTFSKIELDEQISKAGLCSIKYYYPYPDYKFPSEIFTDETLLERKPSSFDYPMDMSRVKLFEERKVYVSLMKLGVIDKFSNSFLVEVAVEPDEEPANVSYVKLSANRNEKFQICTYFDTNKKNVYKKALLPAGHEHLLTMKRFSNYEYGSGILNNIECQQNGNVLSFPFITEDSLEEILIKTCQQNDSEKFFSHINHFRKVLFWNVPLQKQSYSLAFGEIFGNKQCEKELRWNDNVNVDMISGNIFVDNDRYLVIDYEWHKSCQIPMEFILWRMLKQFAEEHDFCGFLTKPVLYDLIGINVDVEECFLNWESHFINQYVGIKDLHSLSKDIVPIDLEKAATQKMKENVLRSSLFLDLGNGFSDANYESNNSMYTSSGFVALFTQKQLRDAKSLRFDPLEGHASCIEIQKIETDGTVMNVSSLNAEKYTDGVGYEFYTYDPQFLINGDFSRATYIKIFFSCTILDWTIGYQKKEEELWLSEKKVGEQISINNHLNTKLGENEVVINQINHELEEKVFENKFLAAKITGMEEQNNIKKIQLEKMEMELINMKEQMDNVKYRLDETQSVLHHITTEMKNRRFKTMLKVLLFGGITRGGSGE